MNREETARFERAFKWTTAGAVALLWAGVLLALLLGGCASIAPSNIANAAVDVEDGLEALQKAYVTASNDPQLAVVVDDLAEAYADFDKAYHDLLGTPAQSCESRCSNCNDGDCVGVHCPLPICLYNCAAGNHPVCCYGCGDPEALTESCASRCKAKCHADEVPSCVAGCVVTGKPHCGGHGLRLP